MTAYYNEFDPKTAAWLRELIKNGLIADGVVDERSIREVQPADLVGFTQCHFFAGIGGWSYALRLAGISDDQPVWTGSCPCQPFSAAGANRGKSDDRHLWSEFHRLIAACRPITVFGEQVEGAIKHGWLDDLQADLEREGYTVGAAVLGAHSVGSYHQRQRLYWVADAERTSSRCEEGPADHEKQKADRSANRLGGCSGTPGSMGDTQSERFGEGWQCGVRLEERSPWSSRDWIKCRDEKYRPIKSGLEPLANGIPARVVRLRGYGNAIVPQVAAEFIEAFYA